MLLQIALILSCVLLSLYLFKAAIAIIDDIFDAEWLIALLVETIFCLLLAASGGYVAYSLAAEVLL